MERKNIKTISPFMAEDFIEVEDSIFNIELYNVFLKENSKTLGQLSKYLICKLHDSKIISILEKEDSFVILLNDISTYLFADTLISEFKLPIKNKTLLFPISLELKGNINVEYNKVDEYGNLIKIEPLELDEYLYEEISKIDDNKLEIIFQFWSNKQSARIIVIVSAEKVELIENQSRAWNEIFGKQYDKYFKYFKQEFNKDRYLLDQNECLTLIKEIK